MEFLVGSPGVVKVVSTGLKKKVFLLSKRLHVQISKLQIFHANNSPNFTNFVTDKPPNLQFFLLFYYELYGLSII